MNDLKRILLVDDSPRDTELMLDALAQHHLANEVVTLRDGAEALDYLYRRGAFAGRTDGQPVVVLLDLKMPKVDGMEVLRQIKGDPELKMIPVVVMTSSREGQDLRNSYQLGVNSYVVKPLDFHEFTDAIKQVGAFWTVINEPPAGSVSKCGDPRQLKRTTTAEAAPPRRKRAEMSHPIHILHLEDNRRDAELIRNQLEAEGLDCEVTLAGDRQAFESALNQGGFDLILCDNSLPDYDGLSALVQARAKQPATPFIFVSGTLGEEVAVECLTTGATDYVLKQRLLRLGPAVRRALADATKAAELNRAEESMRESESKYRQLVESLSDAAFLADEATGRILDTNPQAELLLGRTRWEIVGSPIEGSHSPATAGAFRQWWLALREQRHAPSQDGEIVRADGQVVPVHVTAAHLTFHQRPLILVLYRDITALKQIEARLLRLQSPDAEARANRPLRLLHLEDNPRDAELIRDRLEADGQACEVTLANGRQAFESALEQAAFDLILCDYKLPDYDGGAALMRARAKQPGVPVIIVSGTLGEEAAVDCL
jgi:PAS domain S-box-containing protein